MDMQDKEFDELFRSKLDNLEVNPSEHVWVNISGELNGKRRKIALMPFLSIAASVIVLVTAGLLFIPKKDKITAGQKVKNQEVALIKPTANNTTSKGNATPALVQPGKSPVSRQMPGSVNFVAKIHRTATKVSIIAKYIAPVEEQPQSSNATTDNQPQLAAISERQNMGTSAVVPGDETPIAIKLPAADNLAFTDKPKLATVLPVADKQEPIPVKKHRIRSLGDLINVVVAKVDKRKDKVIEFTDNDDDDESNITGVNLGIIKVKK